MANIIGNIVDQVRWVSVDNRHIQYTGGTSCKLSDFRTFYGEKAYQELAYRFGIK